MGTFGDFGNLGFVSTWVLARFFGPCLVDGVRAEEVLRVGTWTPSARARGTRGRKTRKAGDNGGATRGGKEKKRGGAARRQGPRHLRPENTQRRTQRGRNEGGEGKKKPNNDHQRGNPSREGAEQAKSAPRPATGKVRRTRTRPGGQPARPGQAGNAHAHMRGTQAWRPLS